MRLSSVASIFLSCRASTEDSYSVGVDKPENGGRHGSTRGREDEVIAEEDAVCDICSVLLKAGMKVVRKNCKCDEGLVHKKCALENPECSVCKQVIKCLPATLSKAEAIDEGPSCADRWCPNCFCFKSRTKE